jgi:tetratricopeptide (TPR) repeat protein
MLVRSTLLSIDPDNQTLLVHRWTASELARIWCEEPDGARRLRTAHRRAAEYRQWRARVWSQDRAAYIDDQLEARYHHLAAGDTDQAVEVTRVIVGQLHRWGAWDREAALIHHTLTLLPGTDPRRGAWYHDLGILAQGRGDYQEAERLYRQSLEINERFGDQAGAAIGYGQLGILAGSRGDYQEAERRFRQSLDIDERLGNKAGAATSYQNLGRLSQLLSDYQEAERRYRQSLEINERLGDQAGAASSHNNLGTLAQARGDYPEAERRYRQSLDINERLGNQADTASATSQLGLLRSAQLRYTEAIPLHVEALILRLNLQVPQAQADLSALLTLRNQMPTEQFEAATLSIVDSGTLDELRSLLDSADDSVSSD